MEFKQFKLKAPLKNFCAKVENPLKFRTDRIINVYMTHAAELQNIAFHEIS